MSHLSEAEINHLSELARVDLNQEEKETLGTQLPKIVEFVDQLSQLNAHSVEVVSTGRPLDELRDDTPTGESLSIAALEQLAPEFTHNQIVVPAVLAENHDA